MSIHLAEDWAFFTAIPLLDCSVGFPSPPVVNDTVVLINANVPGQHGLAGTVGSVPLGQYPGNKVGAAVVPPTLACENVTLGIGPNILEKN